MRKLALIALILTIPSLAQAKTLEDLLVEKGVITSNEARATAESAPAKVYWNNGTRLEFPDNGFTTQINTQIQAAYAYTDTDDDLRKAGIGRHDKSSFDVKKAELTLSGTALNQEFSYKLQAEFSNDSNATSRGHSVMKDAYIQWEPCEKMGFRLGQFKTGASRQFNTADWGLQLPTRSVVSDNFSGGRQTGIRAFYSDLDDQYAVYGSMYNGSSFGEGGYGDNEDRSGSDTRHTFDAGIRANILGKMDPFIEGDIDMTEELAINAGANYTYSSAKDLDVTSMGTYGVTSHKVTADATLKYQGFSLAGEFFWATVDSIAHGVTDPIGFYAQTGYFFTPDFEIAARYSFLDCDDSADGICAHNTINSDVLRVSDVNEAAVSLNYYFWKHNLKAQLAYIFQNQGISKGTREYADNNSEDNTNIWMFQISAYL